MESESIITVSVIWRDKHMKVEMDERSSVRELGQKLQNLTKIKADTMRLLLVIPFSEEHSSLRLEEISVLKGKPIRMMGVFEYEIEEVSKNSSNSDSRIRGFDEEEERLRRRLLTAPQSSLKLPQGPYIFCDFRTLTIPGIELNPPPSEALRRMHMLACDPGIIAIMSKHRWRVGIMTEMAPVGYVGVSPKCLLGFNKNRGEEISLRLRTDDLKGFRKYESIKNTLFHELAHMVHSEHDADFYALDKQLKEEAARMDWTRSGSRTLTGHRVRESFEDVVPSGSTHQRSSQKLGGSYLGPPVDPRASSVAAALGRLLSAAADGSERISDAAVELGPAAGGELLEPDPDDGSDRAVAEPDPDDSGFGNGGAAGGGFLEPDPDDGPDRTMTEPDPDDSLFGNGGDAGGGFLEPDPDDGLDRAVAEPDPDDSGFGNGSAAGGGFLEPDPDDGLDRAVAEPDPDDSGFGNGSAAGGGFLEPDPDDGPDRAMTEPDPDDSVFGNGGAAGPGTETEGSSPFGELEEPAAAMCRRLQKAFEALRSEAPPSEAVSSLDTLLKIIRNVIDHPEEAKFRRLRKANPLIQRHVASYQAAMEILAVVGFCEDVVAEEAFIVLKRNDPGLLWLAKSTLEVRL
ncbi:unnamed protein product [Spirodela intermedia]|uniref:WLM domain-containing protein n=1 Tax=Spirodela intermedia TaxID=51605 RepID=A0A7I8IUK7_SPIIN|nr:unnamed protein product [Spirodela intermedia]CAA6661567.1 unnamed protein product [Spirodela intermedia]